METYDAGWRVYGTALADYATETAHQKPVAAPMTKAKRKPRKRATAADCRVMDYGSTPQIKQPEYLMFSTGCNGAIWLPKVLF
jgi:hypothetical protein